MKTRMVIGLATAAMAAVFMSALAEARNGSRCLTPKQHLGKMLFFDEDLSQPEGQSCASCHGPRAGFAGPDSFINFVSAVYPGAEEGRFGNRKPPSAAYAGDTPILHFDEEEELWVGGIFWDGRATGWTLGDPLAEQAQGPFLNPLEQNLPNASAVCDIVAESRYANLFMRVWHRHDMDCDNDITEIYEQIGRSIAAYERSAEVNPFSSKYDTYLRGEAALTPKEQLGLALFEGDAQCAACHPSRPGENGEPPLFTDFTFDNLGVPKNSMNPYYSMPEEWNPDGEDWIDLGLGGFLESQGYPQAVADAEMGKQRVPTLRNVDRRPSRHFVKAYGHNGYFKSLRQIVHFYNTRDVAGAGWHGTPWPAPEYPENVNTEELGDLGLTSEEEDAIVAFLKTLSDRESKPW